MTAVNPDQAPTPAKAKQAKQAKPNTPKSAKQPAPKQTQQPKAASKAQPAKSGKQAKSAPVKSQPKEQKKEEKVHDDDHVKVEEIHEGDVSSDDDVPPPLEEAGQSASGGSGKLNRYEKKARKAIGKLGLKPVTGVNRVTVKKAQDILFIIAKPDIYKTSGADTYVIFGEAKIENLSNNQLASKVKEVIENREGGAEVTEEKPKEAAPAQEPQAPKIEEIRDDEPVDETGISSADIELLMSQSSVSRARAVKALKATNGDIVNAIMQLTSAE
jgi:nascent polypeptide-associated complex subunit alpha